MVILILCTTGATIRTTIAITTTTIIRTAIDIGATIVIGTTGTTMMMIRPNPVRPIWGRRTKRKVFVNGILSDIPSSGIFRVHSNGVSAMTSAT